MLALYSHILVQLKETTKRIKSAKKWEMDQKDNLVSPVAIIGANINSFLTKKKSRQQRLEPRSAWIFLVTASWATCPGPRRRPPTSPSRWSLCSSSPTPPSWSSSLCDRGSSQNLGGVLLVKDCYIYNLQVLFPLCRCPESWCAVFDAFTGISIVINSCLNPYIFLFFNSDNRKASHITSNCCLNRPDRDERWGKPFLENCCGTCRVPGNDIRYSDGVVSQDRCRAEVMMDMIMIWWHNTWDFKM